MSHFTVLVIGDNIREQLAPFQENSMGDCPKKYLAFQDDETDMLEEYETGTSRRVVMPDGSLRKPYDDIFRKSGEFSIGSGTHEVPADLEQREVPFKELYASFEDFACEYHGHDERDPEMGRYGHWSNPNSRWDWYLLGGRWTGMLKLKPGVIGETGLPGLGADRPESGRADSCRLQDIDIEGMRQEAEEAAGKRFDAFHAVLAGREVPSFQAILEKHGDDHAAARQEYWSHPVMTDLSAADLSWGFEDKVGVSREEYLKHARDGALATYAVLKDGVWYERGRMGWWGMAADEQDETEWVRRFAELLDSLPPETLVSVVDCHV